MVWCTVVRARRRRNVRMTNEPTIHRPLVRVQPDPLIPQRLPRLTPIEHCRRIRCIMLRHVNRKRVAAIALFAVLFSALSPALAAFKYRARPAVLAQICTFYGLKYVTPDQQSLPNKSNTTHPIRCAWCMASTAQPSVAVAPVSVIAIQLFAEDRPSPVQERPQASELATAYHSQAPPVFS